VTTGLLVAGAVVTMVVLWFALPDEQTIERRTLEPSVLDNLRERMQQLAKASSQKSQTDRKSST
jgi:predicted MFS family arabinose efflux permease